MRVAVICFPGSNCDDDAARAISSVDSSMTAELVWHTESSLAGFDAVVLPGGFSYGDYLRCGAIARLAPVMRAVARGAAEGMPVLGICNGFQILTEAGLLPGVLRRNAGMRFVCRPVELVVHTARTPFTRGFAKGERIQLPIAHAEGNFMADSTELDALIERGQVVMTYGDGGNPNGSMCDIAAVSNEQGNVVGMMPHPERAVSNLLGSTDGLRVFASMMGAGVEAAHG